MKTRIATALTLALFTLIACSRTDDRGATAPVGSGSAATNTAQNQRDRNGSSVTPMDQGNSRADTEITAQIRKGITELSDFSTNAKNVKIVTQNGAVTLRGPVDTEDERMRIVQLARSVDGVASVDNQLTLAKAQ
jgi:hyperosmotically inducible periplasmic protein